MYIDEYYILKLNFCFPYYLLLQRVTINNKMISSCQHRCCKKSLKTNPYCMIHNINKISWNCKKVNVLIHVFTTEKSDLTHNKLQEDVYKEFNCSKCVSDIMKLLYSHGKNGPVIGNYNALSKSVTKEKQALFSYMYDYSLSIYNKVFMDVPTDNAHCNIRPIICQIYMYKNADAVQYADAVQKNSDAYWLQLHQVMVEISSQWNMAGMCHSFRQKFRKLVSVYSHVNRLSIAMQILNCQVGKFCIPFEHTNMSNRIHIIIDIITDLHDASFTCELFIKLCNHFIKILSVNRTYKTTLDMLTELEHLV